MFLTDLLARKPVILQLLRFACIGALNTALDFLILNLLTDWLGIEQGVGLWLINAVGVVAAIIQSYYWNKHWAFALDTTVSLPRQFIGVILVGSLGTLAFVAAVLPSVSQGLANYGLPALEVSGTLGYYGILLLVFLFLQIVLGANLGFHNAGQYASAATEFGKFTMVSLIGVVINSTVLAVLAGIIINTAPDIGADLAKNIAKFIAVLVSLVWNFIGYKFFVFRK
jgi:putative flippase GtrA